MNYLLTQYVALTFILSPTKSFANIRVQTTGKKSNKLQQNDLL